MASLGEVMIFSSWGLDDGTKETVSLTRTPGSHHPRRRPCHSKCDMTSLAIAITQEQSFPKLETVVAAAAWAARRGRSWARGGGAGRTLPGGIGPSAAQLGVDVVPWGQPRVAKFRAGLSWVRWVLSVQESVLFSLNSAKLDSDDLADGRPDSWAALYASPQPGRRREASLT